MVPPLTIRPIGVEDLRSQLLANCKNPVDLASSKNFDKLEEVRKLVENIDKTFTESARKAETYVQKIVEAYTQSADKSGKAGKAAGKSGTDPAYKWGQKVDNKINTVNQFLRNIQNKLKSGAAPGRGKPITAAASTVKIDDPTLYAKLEEIVEAVKNSSKVVAKATEDSGDGGGGNKKNNDNSDNQGGDSGKRFPLAATTHFLKGVQNATKEFDLMGQIFKGAVRDTIGFAMEMRQIGYQTAGITGDMKEQQQLLVEMDDSVKRTGVLKVQLEQAYLKNLKKGFIDRKNSLKITEEGLHVGKQIGANVDETAELFHRWHVQLGLSTEQSTELGRGIQRIGRETNMTGDALLAVVKSSEKFVKNMRDAGTLSATAATNVIGMRAEAEKLGIGEAIEPMLEAMSKQSSYMAADNKKKNLLGSMAGAGGGDKLQNKLRLGLAMNDRKDIEKMGVGLQKVLYEFGIKNIEDLSAMSDEQRSNASMALQQATGYELTEIERVHKTLQKSGMSWENKLAALSKEENATTTIDSEKKLIQQQRADMQKDFGLAVVTNINKLLKGGATLEAAASTYVTKDLGEGGREDLGQFTGKSTAIDQVSEALRMAVKQAKIDSGGTTDLTKELETALAKGDTKGLREIAKQLEDADKEKKTEKVTNLDEISAMNQLIAKWNEKIRQYMTEHVGLLIKVGAGIALAAGVLNAAAGLGSAAGSGAMGIKSIFGWIKSKFGGGGGGVAGAGPGSNLDQMAIMATSRGSIFVHDMHVEAAIKKKNFGGDSGDMTDELRKLGKRKTWGQRVVQSIKSRGVKQTLLRGVKKKLIQARRILKNPKKWMMGRNLPGGGRSMGAAGRAKNAASGFFGGLKEMLGFGGKAGAGAVGEVGTAKKGLGFFGGLKNMLGLGGKAGAVGAAGEVGAGAVKSVGVLGKTLGTFTKWIPFLAPAIGAVTGMMEGGDGRGVVERGALGALTGGADRGSMFSGMLGIKKGGAGDDAMGVLGAAGYGAATGAALGSFGGPIGTAVGGVVGALVGGGAELYKVLTSEGSALGKSLKDGFSWLMSFFDPLTEAFGELWTELSPIFSGIGGMFSSLFSSVGSIFSMIGSTIGGWFSGFWTGTKEVLTGVGIGLGNLWNMLNPVLAPIGRFFVNLLRIAAFGGIWLIIKGITKTIQFMKAIFDKDTWIGIWMAIKALPGLIWDGIVSAMSGAWSLLKNVGKWLWDKFTWPFKKAWELLKNVGKWLWDGFTWPFKKAWELLRVVGQWLWDGFTWPFKKAWELLKNVGKWLWDKFTWPFKKAAEKLGELKDWLFNEGKTALGRIVDTFYEWEDWMRKKLNMAPREGSKEESKEILKGNVGSAQVESRLGVESASNNLLDKGPMKTVEKYGSLVPGVGTALQAPLLIRRLYRKAVGTEHLAEQQKKATKFSEVASWLEENNGKQAITPEIDAALKEIGKENGASIEALLRAKHKNPVVPAATKPVEKMEHGGQILSDGLVSLHAGEEVVPANVQRLKPASMSTTYERMTQRFVGSGGASGDLSKVEEYNRLQLDQLIILHNDMRELIDSVRPEHITGGSRVARDVSPASYPEPPGSTSYGLWPMGQSYANAQRQSQYPVG